MSSSIVNGGFVEDEEQIQSNLEPEDNNKMNSSNLEGGEDRKDGDDSSPDDIMYKVDDVPPWYLCSLLGLQHYLTMLGGTISIPFVICPALCIEDDNPARGYIISTLFFMSGVVTLLQSTFGIRLPIIQGGTFAFLAPTFAILNLDRNKCPPDFAENGWGNYTEEEKTEEWQRRMREVQGAIIVASFFQLALGFFGIIGVMLKYITPLTIAPAVCLIGLALFPVASDLASQNWAVSISTVIVLILFSQYMRNVVLPFCGYGKSKGCYKTDFYLFKLFPVLLAIVLMWGICAILTVTDALDPSNAARTDLQLNLLEKSQWFRFPYPFQWGMPTVTVAGVFGMLAGILASAIESVGDYYACARLCGAPPPPTHAINRGIGVEGVGCILTGMWGTGNGTTSYSENIGAIGVTKVGSRRVIQYGAMIMIILGLLAKFGALFVTIPSPIVGGMFCVMFGMISAVGLSNLQFVDLNSSRNLFILGFSIFFGLMLPTWVSQNEGTINTGSEVLDQIITVLLETSMFVGGVLGFILDNTVPGSLEERGLIRWRAQIEEHTNSADVSSNKMSTYDIPFVTSYLRRSNWAKYVPFLPTYEDVALKKAILPKRCHRQKRKVSIN